MVILREWNVRSAAFRLARRKGEARAVDIAEKLIRKWAESDAPIAAGAAVRWVKIKAILLSMAVEPVSVH
jgi:hypothetical protein